MPSKKTTSKKPTKRKSVVKKEPEAELKLEEVPTADSVPVAVSKSAAAPAAPAPAAPAAAPALEPVVVSVETDTVNVFDTRLDKLLEHLSLLSKTIKEINTEVKDLKKEITKELKKKDKSKKKKNLENRPPSGFAKPTKLTEELCKFMNIESDSLRARTQVTKFFCDYFKEHNLQDPAYKRNIIPNAAIKEILHLSDGDEVSYFNLQKYLKIHYPKN